MDDIIAECIFNEQVHVKEEEDNIKEEPEWEHSAGLGGISAAAARAGLYANHEVKDELLLGPVGVQPADIAFTLYACQASAARAQPELRECEARPETHVANNADVGNQVHSNANIRTEKQTYVCDICNKRFALKTWLVEHVTIHLRQEREQEEKRVADNALAPDARQHPALRDCAVRLERLEVVELEAGRDERLASRAGSDTDIEKQIHGNIDVGTEEETYICDTCKKWFPLKSQLVEHVVSHIQRQERRRGAGSACAPDARQHPALRDCAVRLERLEVVELEAGRDERLASRAGRDTDIEKEIHGNIDNSTEEETYICDTCKKRFPLKSQLVEHVLSHIQRQESRRGAGSARGGRGEGREPARGGRGEGREPARGGRGEGREPARGGRGEGREPARGGRGEGREPTRAQACRHACLICYKEFPTPSRLKIHERIHTGESPFSCEICQQKFRHLSNLKSHERIHTGEKPFSCGICQQKFTQSRYLKRHERIHTGEKPYSCGICKQKFRDSGSVKKHERINTGEKLYSCGICKRKFTQLGTLKIHGRTHTGQMSFSCGICKQKFTQLGSLKIHERIHTGEKPYSCGICEQKFTQWGCLKNHERIHTGERPFSCGICKQKFTQSGTLMRHERTHTGEKPFACDICKKLFTELRSLKKHNDRFHAD